nr:ThiF family adenylyltransferase [Sorangium cellulosum]
MSGGGGATVRGCVLLVGAGGIAAPAALALAAGGVREIRVADDDEVEITNLHRQILFDADDVGRPKLDAFAEALRRRHPTLRIDRRYGRFTPSAAAALMPGVSVVVDATDNFASRFLIADVCRLTRTPVVHAAAIRWRATVMAGAGGGDPLARDGDGGRGGGAALLPLPVRGPADGERAGLRDGRGGGPGVRRGRRDRGGSGARDPGGRRVGLRPDRDVRRPVGHLAERPRRRPPRLRPVRRARRHRDHRRVPLRDLVCCGRGPRERIPDPR